MAISAREAGDDDEWMNGLASDSTIKWRLKEKQDVSWLNEGVKTPEVPEVQPGPTGLLYYQVTSTW